MTITFDELPEEVIDQTIDALIDSNPTMDHMARPDWFKLAEESYDIKIMETDSDIHFILEPKELV